ncbi:MAG: response regulator [Treponema sp.]|nr:response regulator [Treponema sp.]
MIILIVEDSRPTRNLLISYIKESLPNSRNIFLEAENSETAFKILQKEHIDFVFLDWNLSDKVTGLDILKKIRETEKLKQVPIIMVSSESDKVNVIEALKFGVNDFVAKPIDKKSFTEKLHKVLSKMA